MGPQSEGGNNGQPPAAESKPGNPQGAGTQPDALSSQNSAIDNSPIKQFLTQFGPEVTKPITETTTKTPVPNIGDFAAEKAAIAVAESLQPPWEPKLLGKDQESNAKALDEYRKRIDAIKIETANKIIANPTQAYGATSPEADENMRQLSYSKHLREDFGYSDEQMRKVLEQSADKKPGTNDSDLLWKELEAKIREDIKSKLTAASQEPLPVQQPEAPTVPVEEKAEKFSGEKAKLWMDIAGEALEKAAGAMGGNPPRTGNGNEYNLNQEDAVFKAFDNLGELIGQGAVAPEKAIRKIADLIKKTGGNSQ